MYRLLMLLTILFAYGIPKAQTSTSIKAKNPLSGFGAEWNSPAYQVCYTAMSAGYMSGDEQEVIHILNLLRSNPALFLRSVLQNPKSPYYVRPGEKNKYKTSLVADMRKLKSTAILLGPDAGLFETARCHAESSGKAGYVGHDRLAGCEKGFLAECISYGSADPLEVVMQLLIDEDVPSLGHRKILFDFSYGKAGVATRTHTGYGSNSVICFR